MTDTRKTLAVKVKACVGCRLCEQWCSWTRFKRVDPIKTRIKVMRLDEDYLHIPIVCRQCTKAPCVKACPTEALFTDIKTGAIIVNEEKCVGCKKCLEVCPYGAISIDSEKDIVIICDLCQGDPACVKYCPVNAIQYVRSELVDRPKRDAVAREIARVSY